MNWAPISVSIDPDHWSEVPNRHIAPHLGQVDDHVEALRPRGRVQSRADLGGNLRGAVGAQVGDGEVSGHDARTEVELEDDLRAAVEDRESGAVVDLLARNGAEQVLIDKRERIGGGLQNRPAGRAVDEQVFRNHVDDVPIVEPSGDFQLPDR